MRGKPGKYQNLRDMKNPDPYLISHLHHWKHPINIGSDIRHQYHGLSLSQSLNIELKTVRNEVSLLGLFEFIR